MRTVPTVPAKKSVAKRAESLFFAFINLSQNHVGCKMSGPFVYANVDSLEGKPKVSTGSCASLVQYYLPVGKAATWVAGAAVTESGVTIAKGTAVATFVNGVYPNSASGNHAAFFISKDADGITVMDQWSSKASIGSRKMAFKGKNADGTFKDPSNNGDALSVIMT
jgi:hypothetical protein